MQKFCENNMGQLTQATELSYELFTEEQSQAD